MSNKEKSESISLLEIIIGVFAVIGFIFFIGQLFEIKKESLPKEVETKSENSLEKKKIHSFPIIYIIDNTYINFQIHNLTHLRINSDPSKFSTKNSFFKKDSTDNEKHSLRDSLNEEILYISSREFT